MPDTIQQNMAKPKIVQSDGLRVEQHPLPDQIAAQKFVDGQSVFENNPPFRLFQIVPGGQG